jgi:hypothetical protein
MSFGGYYELSSKVKKALPNFGPTEPKAILSFKVCTIQKTTNLPHDPCAQHRKTDICIAFYFNIFQPPRYRCI